MRARIEKTLKMLCKDLNKEFKDGYVEECYEMALEQKISSQDLFYFLREYIIQM